MSRHAAAIKDKLMSETIIPNYSHQVRACLLIQWAVKARCSNFLLSYIACVYVS